jgi:hypothetical protein
MDDTFRKVEEHLLKVSRARHRGISITPETELYLDLGMYGDDIAFDVVMWVHREFGVEGTFHVTDYCPPEGPLHRLRLLVGRLMRKKERQYKSLKVRDVVAAIEAKRWPE